jgi:prolipoprotein diacylglyceryltransferase
MKTDVPGKRFAAALIFYGVGRFVIEFFRGDAVPVFGPLDVNHIASLLMLFAGTWLWRFRVAFISVAGSKPSV